MIKIFVVGDVHIGKKYDRYPNIKDKLQQSRFACLDRCVKEAEREQCEFLVVTGDLFDNNRTISEKAVAEVVRILAGFGGRVLVLPGNHDFYTGEEKLWKDFQEQLHRVDNNITLITSYELLKYDDIDSDSISFYPAYCDAKHSDTNRLNRLSGMETDDSTYRVGIAHGAIEGISPDSENKYFKMTERELNEFPVDAWLIGHTHVPYPRNLNKDEDISGYKIFNPGTPEQTDLSNNTEGLSFVVTLEREEDHTNVKAHCYCSGDIRYYDLEKEIPESELRSNILSDIRDLSENSIIRMKLIGRLNETEYQNRNKVFNEICDYFLHVEFDDSKISELITPEKIDAEFPEIGFAAQFLKSIEDPQALQMAYDLVKNHRN